MDEKPLRKSWFSRGGVIGIGLVLSILVLVSAVLVARALPGASQAANVAHASGGGGGGSCDPTSGPHCSFKGNTAMVNFFLSSPDGCISLNGFIEVVQNVTHNPPDPKVSGNTVFASVFQDDVCNGIVIDASGQASDVNFQADKDLTTASSDASVEVVDFISGNTFTLTFNLTWEGVGAVSKNVDSSHFRTEGTIINTHFSGTSRFANVFGDLHFNNLDLVSPSPSNGVSPYRSTSSNSGVSPNSGGGGCTSSSSGASPYRSTSSNSGVSPNSGGGGGGCGLFGGELQYAQSGSVDLSHPE